MQKCAWCDEPNMEEFADPNAKDICIFCVEERRN